MKPSNCAAYHVLFFLQKKAKCNFSCTVRKTAIFLSEKYLKEYVTKHLKSILKSYSGSKTGPRFPNGIKWGSHLDSIFFSRIPKKMLVQPTGILPEDYQDYKKKNKKKLGFLGFYKKTREKILGFHRKTFFWIPIFFTSDSKFFFWDSGILDQKKYDFCDICDPVFCGGVQIIKVTYFQH